LAVSRVDSQPESNTQGERIYRVAHQIQTTFANLCALVRFDAQETSLADFCGNDLIDLLGSLSIDF